MAKDADILTSNELDALIISIYLGEIDVYNLPLNLYSQTWDYYAKGLIEGFGDIITAEQQVLFESLFQNVQLFSGAKTANQILDYQSFLLTEKGIARDFIDFKKLVLAKYETYNKTWLKTEYEFIVESAKAAKRWTKIQANKELFDLLEYVTAGDDRVRPSHKALDGIIRKVDDPFWNKYYPPWEWRCRCTTKSYSSEDVTVTEWV